ncbi:MAG: hypothetical protein VW080_04415 [Flavobacteriaceae bacterium]
MRAQAVFYFDVLGFSLFIIPSVLGVMLLNHYSILSQLIRESYAVDTEYGWVLRALGFIPSGILFFFLFWCFVFAAIQSDSDWILRTGNFLKFRDGSYWIISV